MQSNERMASRNTALVCGCLPAKLLTLWSTQRPDSAGPEWGCMKLWLPELIKIISVSEDFWVYMIWHVGNLWQRKGLSLCWNTINTVETGRKFQNNARLKPSSSDTQSPEHYVPPPLLLTLTSQRNQKDLIPDCAIFMISEKKIKGSPPSFHSRSVTDSLPVRPPAFLACRCQLGILPRHYTGVGNEPSLPAPWLPWSGSARVLHGHLERVEHLDAA